MIWKQKGILLLLAAFGLNGCAGSSFFLGDTDAHSISRRTTSCIAIQSKANETELSSENCNLLALAMQSFDDEKYSESEKYFQQSIKNFKSKSGKLPNENLKSSYYGLAASYDQEGRFKEADVTYEKIKSMFGEDLRYYNNLGYSLYLRGKTEAAIATIKKALLIEPNNAVTLENYRIVTGG